MDWLIQYADPAIDWNYAMVTLVVRFIGVFIVMAVVQVALQASSHVIHFLDARKDKATRQAAVETVSLDLSSMADHEADMDGAVIAAIAAALNLEAAGTRRETPVPSGKASAWAMSGRLRGMR